MATSNNSTVPVVRKREREGNLFILFLYLVAKSFCDVYCPVFDDLSDNLCGCDIPTLTDIAPTPVVMVLVVSRTDMYA